MSTSSNHKHSYSRRVESLRSNSDYTRDDSRSSRRRHISSDDAYTYALRVAYLAYLLQPRQKRKQHQSTPSKQIKANASSSLGNLMKDFTTLGNSKSTKFPHGFMDELEKRLTGVMMGREKRQEYQEAAVKRSFAAYLNAFIEPQYKKRMEKDRQIEEMVLKFFSEATKVLQVGKKPDDDSWKLMVDRHVALFVRLLSIILKDSDAWSRDRPELTSRLATLEGKLLAHDDDLATDGLNGSLVEVVAPLTYEVKDMPLVQTVGRIFFKRPTQLQADIDANRNTWTESAALEDLKKYQKFLALNSKPLLNSDDFDLEEAYDIWKKAEVAAVSQMLLTIFQANPQLAKSSKPGHGPSASVMSIDTNRVLGHQPSSSVSGTSTGNTIRPVRSESYSAALASPSAEDYSMYLVDQPVDMSGMAKISPVTSRSGSFSEGDEPTFVFVPSDPRGHYRAILSQALVSEQSSEDTVADQAGTSTFLTKSTIDLLNELCVRWRIPYFSRIVLLLDVCRDRFLERAMDVERLVSAFEYVREPVQETKKDSVIPVQQLFDRSKWTLADIALNQQVLRSLNDALLRDLYDIATRCYEPRPPSVGVIVFILENFIFNDESFPKDSSDLEEFSNTLRVGLREKAREAYQEYVLEHVPQDPQDWYLTTIINLGQAITDLGSRIQKRYRKNPEIMGVNPYTELLKTVLPPFAKDAQDLVEQITRIAEIQKEQIPPDEGFDLYKELVKIRTLHASSLPEIPFPFNVEEVLVQFVWRWIELTETQVKTWMEGAIQQDSFQVRGGIDADDDQKHSTSVIDIFTAFNQPIDKVIQLDWDNDLHYAKFMTAFAKIVGLGLARYCELVEQRFSKEMDRLTPEQEAAASQTRQEKFLQLAKDAWNTKEKIEPFQFFPESFVKLNNIEFAMRQLDKLEKEVNVDGCVEVIERNTPPVTIRQRKISNYVFTIKIVEAEDLKACDMNGLSDPYVVLGDEYQKRLAKTRIIHGNLNPRWDETVDILTQGPLNVVATVWDWDQLGEHDCVGRTSIKLDPSHFSDFLPREYWLDLDTQGRLLLRISMEGERDDIQFYFGKAFRILKRTERDMTRTITDKLSAYINHCLSRRALKSLLSKPISIATVSSYFNRNKQVAPPPGPTQAEIAGALKPLFTYFDDNFAIMNQTLTREAMLMVMARLWKEVLITMESLVVPPLSDKPSQQKPLNQQELDIVFKWLDLIFQFFNAVDEETGVAHGVPQNILQSPKYFDIRALNFFYNLSTEDLIRESEQIASASASRQQFNRNRLSAPAGLASLHSASDLMAAGGRRTKSIMLSCNLGTMKKAKEEKRKEAQAEPSDDMILRILRMRPEAQRYLKDRSRQKERLAAAAAAELIVKQSLLAGGGRMTSSIPRR